MFSDILAGMNFVSYSTYYLGFLKSVKFLLQSVDCKRICWITEACFPRRCLLSPHLTSQAFCVGSGWLKVFNESYYEWVYPTGSLPDPTQYAMIGRVLGVENATQRKEAFRVIMNVDRSSVAFMDIRKNDSPMC